MQQSSPDHVAIERGALETVQYGLPRMAVHAKQGLDQPRQEEVTDAWKGDGEIEVPHLCESSSKWIRSDSSSA